MAEDKASYSVEVREATRGGDDYTENHYDFDTPEQVRNFIENEMHEDESVHSVLYYAKGQTCNPTDITHNFRSNRKRK